MYIFGSVILVCFFFVDNTKQNVKKISSNASYFDNRQVRCS